MVIQEVSSPGLLLKARPAMGSDQVAQGFDQLGVGNLQGWRLHSLCEQCVPLLDGTQEEKSFSL